MNGVRVGSRLFGLIAVLTAVSSVVHVGIIIALPNIPTLHEIQVFKANQGLYIALFFSVVSLALFGIPFVGGLGSMFASRGPLLAGAATLLLASGLLADYFGAGLSDGALNAVVQSPSEPAYQASAAYAAALWGNMRAISDAFGLPLTGFGLLLFSRLAWRSDILPNWVTVVGVIGGVAAFPATVVSAVAPLPFLALDVWAVVVGVLVLRGRLARDGSREVGAAERI